MPKVAKKHKKRFHCLNTRKQNPYVVVRMARILERVPSKKASSRKGEMEGV